MNTFLPKLMIIIHRCHLRTPFHMNVWKSSRFSPQTVKDVFDGLDTSKATGPNLMSPRLLKEGSSILEEPYSILYTFLSSARSLFILFEGRKCYSNLHKKKKKKKKTSVKTFELQADFITLSTRQKHGTMHS